jgi:hypothetical protein
VRNICYDLASENILAARFPQYCRLAKLSMFASIFFAAQTTANIVSVYPSWNLSIAITIENMLCDWLRNDTQLSRDAADMGLSWWMQVAFRLW